MSTTAVDTQSHEAEIEAIKEVIATVEHSQNKKVRWRLTACQNTGVLDGD